MGKLNLIDQLKNWLSDTLFALFLKVNGISKEEYYRQWIGYTKEDHKNRPDL